MKLTGKKIISAALLYLFLTACNHPEENQQVKDQSSVFKEGEFGYDLQFLKKQDSALIILVSGNSRVIISPRYQAKVFTSTANGDKGLSFGWINYKAFGKEDAHMNAYGGENRLWLGPEGGKFSLFFKPGTKMTFDNWKTPAQFDTEHWNVRNVDSQSVTMYKNMDLLNYAGTRMELQVVRSISILNRDKIIKLAGISESEDSLYTVGYETGNTLTNTGELEWTETSGMPCIWLLDMFKPSSSSVIVVPFKKTVAEDFKKVVTTNYFGEIPPDRIKNNDSLIFFRADGKSRGKLGISANGARGTAGSYDGKNKVLTVISFNVEAKNRYLNQEWNITKPSFQGDAVNAYNDGPLADGTQMGPFYEIESVSQAAFIKPGESINHSHVVMHFSGNEKTLDKIATRMLGAGLEKINKSFEVSHY
ncbi:MAG TPA: DUF6786 family protein [Puia sp.]|nr:DUF6786 family protein [Puia sp.]